MVYDDFDAASHGFGLVATAALYRRLTGDGRFDRFATAQRDWLLGANPWGVSLVIGVGSRFPRCPQHVAANLSGGRDGHRPLLLGAVVNGPNDRWLFADVQAWQTVEPAIAFTATAALAFALTE